MSDENSATNSNQEVFPGIILWSSKDGSDGVIADLAGETYRFKEQHYCKGEYEETYLNGFRPQTSTKENPLTGSEIVVTEPTLVYFSIEFFTRSDGRPGETVLSIEDAVDIWQEDAEALYKIRQAWEDKEKAERVQGRRAKSGYRTRAYQPI